MKEFWSSRIAGIEPYVPGEQPKERTYIKLNTNENPYPPCPGVVKAMEEESGAALRLYPDPECTRLREALAQRYGLGLDQVFVGNGSDEVLGMAFAAFFDQGSTVAFPDITYSFYPVYADLFGIRCAKVPLNPDFTMPVEEFCTGAYQGLVICNPNAPTGILLSLEEIRRIVAANPNVVVIVDEAYIDFGGESAVPLISEYPNLLVVQTMSKSRSLAGLRVGMAFGQPNLISGLNAVKNSFNSYTLDRVAIAAGTAAVKDEEYFRTTCRQVAETREKTAEHLKTLGFSVLPSSSNFLFVSHPKVAAAQLQQQLRERGILVRHFHQPRIENFLRVSIGTREDMNTFCQTMAELVNQV
jgi:histidinol-phosphate aminotransferase